MEDKKFFSSNTEQNSLVAPDQLSPNRTRNIGHDPNDDIVLGKSKSVAGPMTPPKEL